MGVPSAGDVMVAALTGDVTVANADKANRLVCNFLNIHASFLRKRIARALPRNLEITSDGRV